MWCRWLWCIYGFWLLYWPRRRSCSTLSHTWFLAEILGCSSTARLARKLLLLLLLLLLPSALLIEHFDSKRLLGIFDTLLG
jgi:hypothetical protein